MAPRHLATLQQKQSPLFKLPPELRNQIYSMVFECPYDSIDLTKLLGPSYRDLDRTPDLGAAAPPSSALLRSCQRIHDESASIFAFQAVRSKEFRITVSPPEVVNFPSYIKHMSDAYLARIGHFTFLMRSSYPGFLVDITLKRSAEETWDVTFTNQSFCMKGVVINIAAIDLIYQQLCAGGLDWYPGFLRGPLFKRKLRHVYRVMSTTYSENTIRRLPSQ